MRIVSGKWRGRKLKTPKGMEIRPTSEIVKQALFNILAFGLKDATVLDLFAGTGQVGLEALSCGAKQAVFADKGRQSLQLLKENIQQIGAQEQSRILPMDYLDAMNRLAAGKEMFDIIFADPPYQGGYYETIMKKTVDLGLLNEYGVLVLEHDSKEIFPPAEGLKLVSRRKYGRRSLMILSVEGDEKINETDLSGKL